MEARLASRSQPVLAAITALAAMVVASVGVFGRGDGVVETVRSVRGETYPMVVSGVYAFNAQRVVAEGVGWDVFTLFAAAPALLFCAPGLARGSLRARLVAAGLFAYVLYQYLEYALTWAFGPLLLPFVVLAILGLLGVIATVASVAGEPIEQSLGERFPRRGVAALAFVLGGILVVMWLARITKALAHPHDAELLGQTTMVVQVLDLALVVPAATLTGVLALRRHRAGYILASIFVVKAIAMASAICAMLLMAWRVEGKLDVVPLAIFSGGALAAAFLGARILRTAPKRLARGG